MSRHGLSSRWADRQEGLDRPRRSAPLLEIDELTEQLQLERKEKNEAKALVRQLRREIRALQSDAGKALEGGVVMDTRHREASRRRKISQDVRIDTRQTSGRAKHDTKSRDEEFAALRLELVEFQAKSRELEKEVGRQTGFADALRQQLNEQLHVVDEVRREESKCQRQLKNMSEREYSLKLRAEKAERSARGCTAREERCRDTMKMLAVEQALSTPQSLLGSERAAVGPEASTEYVRSLCEAADTAAQRASCLETANAELELNVRALNEANLGKDEELERLAHKVRAMEQKLADGTGQSTASRAKEEPTGASAVVDLADVERGVEEERALHNELEEFREALKVAQETSIKERRRAKRLLLTVKEGRQSWEVSRSALVQRAEESEHEVLELRRSSANALRAVERMRREVADANGWLQAEESVSRASQAAVSKAEAVLQEQIERCEALLREKDAVGGELAASRAECERLESEVTYLRDRAVRDSGEQSELLSERERATDAERVLAQARGELEGTRLRLARSEKDCENAMAGRAKLQSELQAAKSDLALQHRRVAEAEASVTRARTALSDADSEHAERLAALEKEARDAQHGQAELSVQAGELRDERELLLAQLTSSEADVVAARAERDALQTALTLRAQELDDARLSSVENLRGAERELRARADGEVAAVKLQLTEAEQQLLATQRETQALRQASAAHKGQLERQLEDQKQQTEELRGSLQRAADAAQDRQGALEAQLAATEQRLSRELAQTARVERAKVEVADAEASSVRVSLADAVRELEALGARQEVVEEALGRREAELAAVRSESERAKVERDSATLELAALRAQSSEDLRRQRQRAEEQLAAVRKSLEEALGEAARENSALTERLHEEQELRSHTEETFTRECEALEARNDQLRAEYERRLAASGRVASEVEVEAEAQRAAALRELQLTRERLARAEQRSAGLVEKLATAEAESRRESQAGREKLEQQSIGARLREEELKDQVFALTEKNRVAAGYRVTEVRERDALRRRVEELESQAVQTGAATGRDRQHAADLTERADSLRRDLDSALLSQQQAEQELAVARRARSELEAEVNGLRDSATESQLELCRAQWNWEADEEFWAEQRELLERSITEMRSELAESQRTSVARTAELSALSVEVERLRAQQQEGAAAGEEQLADALGRAARRERELRLADMERSAAEQRSLEAQNRLQADVTRANRQAEALARELADVRTGHGAELEALQARVERQRSRAKDAEEQLAVALSSAVRVDAAAKEREKLAAADAARLSEADELVAGLTRELSDARQELEMHHKTVAELRDKLAAVELKSVQAAADTARLMVEHNDALTAARVAREDAERAEKEHTSEVEQHAEDRRLLGEHDDRLHEALAAQSRAEEVLRRSEALLAASKDEISGLSERLAELAVREEAALEDAQLLRAAAEAEQASFSQERDGFKRAIQELEDDLAKSLDELEAVETELGSSRSEEQRLREKTVKLQTGVEEAARAHEGEKKQTQDQLEKAKRQLALERARAAHAGRQKDAELEDLRTQLKEANASAQDSGERVEEALAAERERRVRADDEHRSELLRMRKKIEELSAECERARAGASPSRTEAAEAPPVDVGLVSQLRERAMGAEARVRELERADAARAAKESNLLSIVEELRRKEFDLSQLVEAEKRESMQRGHEAEEAKLREQELQREAEARQDEHRQELRVLEERSAEDVRRLRAAQEDGLAELERQLKALKAENNRAAAELRAARDELQKVRRAAEAPRAERLAARRAVQREVEPATAQPEAAMEEGSEKARMEVEEASRAGSAELAQAAQQSPAGAARIRPAPAGRRPRPALRKRELPAALPEVDGVVDLDHVARRESRALDFATLSRVTRSGLHIAPSTAEVSPSALEETPEERAALRREVLGRAGVGTSAPGVGALGLKPADLRGVLKSRPKRQVGGVAAATPLGDPANPKEALSRLRRSGGAGAAAGAGASAADSPEGTVSDPLRVCSTLWRVKGKRRICSHRVALHAGALNSGDVFLLVTAQEIFRWEGSGSGRMKRAKAHDMSERLRAQRGAQRPVRILSEDSPDRSFWSVLGGEKPARRAAAGGEDAAFEKTYVAGLKLYEVGLAGADGTGSEQEVTETPVERPYAQSQLYEDGVYVLDAAGASAVPAESGFTVVPEVYLWIGRRSALPLRSAGLRAARERIGTLEAVKETARFREGVHFSREVQGGESVTFGEKFASWSPAFVHTRRPRGHGSEGQQLATAKAKAKDFRFTPVAADLEARRRAEQEAAAKHLSIREMFSLKPDLGSVPQEDAGSGELEVYVCHGSRDSGGKQLVPKGELGHFFAKNAYIVVYRFTEREKEKYTLFYWLGSSCPRTEAGTASMLVMRVDESMGREAIAKERVVMGHESAWFMHIFAGAAVIHLGHRDDWNPQARAAFVVRGALGSTQAVEVEVDGSHCAPHVAVVLNTETQQHVWIGPDCTAAIRKAVPRVAEVVRGTREDSAGGEEADFWVAAGGVEQYRNLAHSTAERQPRMFLFREIAKFEIEEVAFFNAEDLLPGVAALLDLPSLSLLCVWMGSEAKDSLQKRVLELVSSYVAELPMKPTRQIYVAQGTEPKSIRCFFVDSESFGAPSDQPVDVELAVILRRFSRTIPLSVLQARPLPDRVDAKKLETYLSNEEFEGLFGMERETFYATVPVWKQLQLKKRASLY